MKRAREDAVSTENATHPLIRILTMPNYSTVRRKLYDALNLAEDKATFWSLWRLAPGVRLPDPGFGGPLYNAEKTIVMHKTAATPALQREILTFYRREYEATFRLEAGLEKAISHGAPLDFLRFLWNEHLTPEAKTNYVKRILECDNHFSDFGPTEDGCGTVTFLWENVFLPNMGSDDDNGKEDGRVTDAILRHYMKIFLFSHFSFSVVCWFQTKLYPYWHINWSHSELYVCAVRGNNYHAARDCWACMSNADKDEVQLWTPHVYELVYNDDEPEWGMRCEHDEIHEFLGFLFHAHGPCTMQQFWGLAYCFTEGPVQNDRCYAVLAAYYASHFPDILSDEGAECILKWLDESTEQTTHYKGFTWFLSDHLQGILAQLLAHPLFAAWMQRLLINFNRPNNFWNRECEEVLEGLRLPEHMIKPFTRSE